MTHFTMQAGFPDLPLLSGMKIRLRAVSATQDAAVAGVLASQWGIYGWDASAEPETSDIPPYSLEERQAGN